MNTLELLYSVKENQIIEFVKQKNGNIKGYEVTNMEENDMARDLKHFSIEKTFNISDRGLINPIEILVNNNSGALYYTEPFGDNVEKVIPYNDIAIVGTMNQPSAILVPISRDGDYAEELYSRASKLFNQMSVNANNGMYASEALANAVERIKN